MGNTQPGILAPVPPHARYLSFSLKPGSDPRGALSSLLEMIDGERVVAGIGMPVVLSLKAKVEGLRTFPSQSGPGVSVPATPSALWCWLRGDDRGDILHAGRRIARAASAAFALDKAIDAFQYGTGLDLTGYEDGTENPRGEKAVEVAVVGGSGPGIDGSSFVAVQQWVHDLDRFDAMGGAKQDESIGRRRSDNEELGDAPASAHVKRTAQESFEPAAFILRRSMPWADGEAEGLVFVAFGRSLDPFEALLRRMTGAEDGVTDALFRFTRPVTGSYYWCPPVAKSRLDLRAIGIN